MMESSNLDDLINENWNDDLFEPFQENKLSEIVDDDEEEEEGKTNDLNNNDLNKNNRQEQIIKDKEAWFRYKNDRRKKKKKLDKTRRKEFLASLTIPERIVFINQERYLKSTLNQRMKEALTMGIKIIIDLSYENYMSDCEIRSLSLQICQAVTSMKSNQTSFSMNLCPMKGKIQDELIKMGIKKWLVNKYDEEFINVPDIICKNIVYLSPDSEEDLKDVSNDCAYVIGGIVDRTVKKNLSLTRAKDLGVKCFRLPIKEFITDPVKKVMNIDTVCRILHNYTIFKDWEKSLQESIPKKFYRTN